MLIGAGSPLRFSLLGSIRYARRQSQGGGQAGTNGWVQFSPPALFIFPERRLEMKTSSSGGEQIAVQQGSVALAAVAHIRRTKPKRSACKWGALMIWLAISMLSAARAQQQPDLGSPSPAAENRIPYLHSDDSAIEGPQKLIEARRYPDADEALRGYLETHTESAVAHFLLGYTLYREDHPRESLAEYTSGARSQNPAANDLAVVAMDYILLHDYTDADKWLTRATAMSPGTELYWYYLGRVKYVENRFEEAIAVFQKCLALSPQNLPAEYNLGLAYAGAGRTAEATTAYQTAIAWQQTSGVPDPQPYLDWGVMLLEQGKPAEALPLLQRAVALGPQNPRAHEQLGQAWKQLHNLPKADAELQAAIRLAPKISALHFEMGRIFQLEGLTAKAKEEFALCSSLNASHSTDAAQTPNVPPRN